MIKKLTLFLSLLIGLHMTIDAQPRAIGARIGGDIDFSYQHQLGRNMLDCSAGFGFGGSYMAFGAAAAYDWIFPFRSWTYDGAWNWYVGPAAGVGFVFGGADRFRVPVSLSIGGQIGVEYQFWFPLTLSLDYRPMINLLGFTDRVWARFAGISLGVRYRF